MNCRVGNNVGLGGPFLTFAIYVIVGYINSVLVAFAGFRDCWLKLLGRCQ